MTPDHVSPNGPGPLWTSWRRSPAEAGYDMVQRRPRNPEIRWAGAAWIDPQVRGHVRWRWRIRRPAWPATSARWARRGRSPDDVASWGRVDLGIDTQGRNTAVRLPAPSVTRNRSASRCTSWRSRAPERIDTDNAALRSAGVRPPAAPTRRYLALCHRRRSALEAVYPHWLIRLRHDVVGDSVCCGQP